MALPLEREEARAGDRRPTLRRALVGFGLSAAVILFAARYLAGSAAELADLLGVSTGFIGLVLLALTTSLPDVVVSIASIRAGAYDLAVGNLLGSNCFNMVVLLVLDVADGSGSLLASVPPAVGVGALFAIVLVALVQVGVLNQAEPRRPYLESTALVVVLLYVAGLALSYIAIGSP